MRRGNWFWAIVLILLGVLLLLSNLGVIGDVWPIFWPLALVALGVWMLLGALLWRQRAGVEAVTVPLEGASRASVRVRHGAGRLQAAGGLEPGQLMKGEFGSGLDYRARRHGDRVELDMRVPNVGFPWGWGWGGRGFLDWSFALSSEVPLDLEFDTGASEARMDLSQTLTSRLRLNTGASSTEVTLPTNAVLTRVDVHAGAASVVIRVPSTVAARIRFRGGLASIGVDRGRFPKVGGEYRSADYDTAANKADIDVEAGVGSIRVI